MGGTSSNRRKHRSSHPRRASPSPRRTTAPSISTLAFDDRQITSGPGFELLKKSGWQPGETLGAPSTPPARDVPIPIVVRRGRAGVGAVAPSHPLPHSLPSNYRMPLPRSERPAHLANMDIFDPLRPRCQFDPSHVVANLKALNKHEKSCPANPRRSSRVVASALTTPASHPLVPTSPASFGNQFSQLASSSASSSTSLSSEVDSVLSDFSELSCLTAENDCEHAPFCLDHPTAS